MQVPLLIAQLFKRARVLVASPFLEISRRGLISEPFLLRNYTRIMTQRLLNRWKRNLVAFHHPVRFRQAVSAYMRQL